MGRPGREQARAFHRHQAHKHICSCTQQGGRDGGNSSNKDAGRHPGQFAKPPALHKLLRLRQKQPNVPFACSCKHTCISHGPDIHAALPYVPPHPVFFTPTHSTRPFPSSPPTASPPPPFPHLLPRRRAPCTRPCRGSPPQSCAAGTRGTWPPPRVAADPQTAPQGPGGAWWDGGDIEHGCMRVLSQCRQAQQRSVRKYIRTTTCTQSAHVSHTWRMLCDRLVAMSALPCCQLAPTATPMAPQLPSNASTATYPCALPSTTHRCLAVWDGAAQVQAGQAVLHRVGEVAAPAGGAEVVGAARTGHARQRELLKADHALGRRGGGAKGGGGGAAAKRGQGGQGWSPWKEFFWGRPA